jgi:hypothetical protein
MIMALLDANRDNFRLKTFLDRCNRVSVLRESEEVVFPLSKRQKKNLREQWPKSACDETLTDTEQSEPVVLKR